MKYQTSCEAAASVKPEATLCEPWVASNTIVRSRGAATCLNLGRRSAAPNKPITTLTQGSQRLAFLRRFTNANQYSFEMRISASTRTVVVGTIVIGAVVTIVAIIAPGLLLGSTLGNNLGLTLAEGFPARANMVSIAITALPLTVIAALRLSRHAHHDSESKH